MRTFLALLLLASPAAAQPALQAYAKGVLVSSATADELSARVSSSFVAFPNPFLDGRAKGYEAFPMAAVLDALYGKGWRDAPGADVTFRAKDGYEARVPSAELAAGGAWLAFRDLDRAPDWEPVGPDQADPAPFFLVWEPGHPPEKGTPWPWQVVAFDTTRFEDVYPALSPQGAAAASPEERGYRLFRDRCVKCHALDKEGGTVGPDLLAPRPVVDYRPKAQLEAFIRQASSFQYGKMPDQTDLTDRDLEDLWRYLKSQARRRAPAR
ncbi:MAG: cytochrome c [Elusimicrobia bacterium]|nr:cytochrome c [Elusimicrobiota bacterium]